MTGFDPHAFNHIALILADFAREDEDGVLHEALLRTAANRAYYAAYLKARSIAERHGFSIKNKKGSGNSHEYLWSWYADPGERPAVFDEEISDRLSGMGNAMRQMRTEADYKPHKPFKTLPQEIMERIDEFEDLFQDLYKASPSVTPRS